MPQQQQQHQQQHQPQSTNYTSTNTNAYQTNTQRLNDHNDQQYSNYYPNANRTNMDDLNNQQNGITHPLLADVDLDSDRQAEMYLDMGGNNMRRSRFSNIQSPSVLARKPPNTLPPLSNLGLVDMPTNNQYSSALLRSPNLTGNPNHTLPPTTINNAPLLLGTNSYRSQLPLGPDSDLKYNLAGIFYILSFILLKF